MYAPSITAPLVQHHSHAMHYGNAAKKGSTRKVKSNSLPKTVAPGRDGRTGNMLANGEYIWRRLVKGDTSAMGELYDAVGTTLYSLSFRILNDRWEAEEVVQDVLGRLWNNPDSFTPTKGKLHSWLLTMTRNRSIDRYRSRRRRKDDSEMDEVTLQTRADPVAANAADEAEGSDERKALQDAMGKLGEKQREILELSFFRGMSHSQIANDTGLSLGTVKSRIRLGLDNLRGQLATLRAT